MAIGFNDRTYRVHHKLVLSFILVGLNNSFSFYTQTDSYKSQLGH